MDRVSREAGGPPILIENLPWPEISALRDQNGSLLVLPLGATEQHGPHLPVNADTLIVQAACWFASAKTDAPILPVLPITVSVGHTPKWPGTFSVWHETFIATLREIAAWCAATGWRRLLFVNSHFGNDACLRVAVDQIRCEHVGTLQVASRNTFNLTPAIWDAFTTDAADLHANKAETDLLLFLAPELVKMDALAASDDPDRTANSVFSHPVPQTSLNGVTGSPSLATSDAGSALFFEIANALAALIERAKSDAPPLDASHWRDLPSLAPTLFAR
jgi:creatinine amidohydrolase